MRTTGPEGERGKSEYPRIPLKPITVQSKATRPARAARLCAGSLAALALASCAKPLPPEKSAYAGAWTGPGFSLVISPEGRVAYRRANDGGSWRKIDAPLQAFQGDDFVVGVGPLKTTFVVSAPPRQIGGAWKMTVDGVELIRAP